MKKKSKARIRTPVEKLTSEDTIQHYNAIMLEQITSKIDIVIEGMESLRRELRGEVAALRNEMNARFEVVDAAIRCNAHGIKELRSMMHQAIGRLDGHEVRITNLETA